MYHCNFIINIISKHETIKEELKEVPAPERFHLEYIMDMTWTRPRHYGYLKAYKLTLHQE